MGCGSKENGVLFAGRKRRNWDEHVFLAHHKAGRVQRGEFEAVTMRNGVGWAGFDTIAAEDAAVVVDVVDLGEALGRGDALLFGVLGSLNVNAVGRAGGCAKEAGYAFFQAVFVALQNVRSAKTCLEVLRRAGGRGRQDNFPPEWAPASP